jgi:hypothetical protein
VLRHRIVTLDSSREKKGAADAAVLALQETLLLEETDDPVSNRLRAPLVKETSNAINTTASDGRHQYSVSSTASTSSPSSSSSSSFFYFFSPSSKSRYSVDSLGPSQSATPILTDATRGNPEKGKLKEREKMEKTRSHTRRRTYVYIHESSSVVRV